MDRLLHDLRYALRKLVKDRGLTITAGLTLAVGVGLIPALRAARVHPLTALCS